MAIRISVLLARDTSNPNGFPPSWPVSVEEITDDSVAIEYPRISMSKLEYEQYCAAYQDVFDAWERQKCIADHRAACFERLWTACHLYEFQFYSGGAYAQILELKLSGSVKARASGDWILHLWEDYYARKSQIAASVDTASMDAVSTDFSNNGHPPYTIPEMLQEALESLHASEDHQPPS